MRLVLDRRARRLLARLPRYNWYSVAELALLALLALVCARLVLTLATPVGPVGGWRPDDDAAAASPSLLGSFDPFFRLAGDPGAAVVTGLDIKLFGIRADQASGRGSAIVGLPNGVQSSVSVGEEIMAGVTLKAVMLDHVTILRGGVAEQIYLDQSQPATVVSPPLPVPAGVGGISTMPPPPPAANPLLPAPSAPISAAALASAARLAPRLGRNGVNGFTIEAQGDGSALRAAGIQPGDVIVSVNGARVESAADATRIQQQLGRSGEATVVVERGGSEVPVRVSVTQ